MVTISFCGQISAQTYTRQPFTRYTMGKRKIKSLSDCQRLLAWTLNQLIDDKIEESKASKIAYITNILKGIIVDSDLEERIAKLEERAKQH